MAAHSNPAGKHDETAPSDEARSGGERSAAGSNYGDWRPKSPAPDTGSPPADETQLPPGAGLGNPPDPQAGAAPVPGVKPSTQPSGIGSTPHK